MSHLESSWRPLFVLGIDRSGTSLVSELLSLWGVHAGKRELLCEATVANPHGYFEYAPMQEFVYEIIQNVGLSPWDPGFKALMKRQASDPTLRRRALELAAEMEHPDRPWFWKENDFVFSLPFWSELFPDPVYLITLRNPCDSAASYKQFHVLPVLRDKIDVTGYFFLRWQYFMVTIFEELKSYPHKHVVCYENLISSPHAECERICAFLEGEYGALAAGDPDRVGRMAQAIDPNLWRYNGKVPFAASPAASEAQKDLYAYLMCRLEGSFDDFDATRYPFPLVFHEYMSNMTVLRWLIDNL